MIWTCISYGRETKVERAMEMRAEGTMRKRRPRIKWEDTVEKIANGKER